jgi:hypothetical protein
MGNEKKNMRRRRGKSVKWRGRERRREEKKGHCHPSVQTEGMDGHKFRKSWDIRAAKCQWGQVDLEPAA